MSIARGWGVVSSDGKRVGDVTEVHPHYLLVTRGVLRVKDMYLPLGTVAHIEDESVVLTVTYDVLRKMNLSHEPPPIIAPEPEPLQDPVASGYDSSEYPSEADTSDEPLAFPGAWESETELADETPSYARPQPNGLVEVEHSLNLAFDDLGYGSPILLLQGWPFDRTVWEPLPTILAADHRVITFDMRGSGDSDKPWDYYSVDTLVHDLHRVFIELTLRDVTLVAWSSAASVALDYAREHPARIGRVVLLSPLILSWLAEDDAQAWVGHTPELDRATQDAWTAELVDDRPALFEHLIDRLTNAPLSRPRRRWLWQRMMHSAPHAQSKTLEMLRLHSPDGLLADIKPPVTIFSGELDRLSPPGLGARLAEALPRAQLVTLSECGHASFIEQRTAVVQAILELVDGQNEQADDNEATIEGEQAAEDVAEDEAGLVGTDSQRSLLVEE
jgi:peroxiredoxin